MEVMLQWPPEEADNIYLSIDGKGDSVLPPILCSILNYPCLHKKKVKLPSIPITPQDKKPTKANKMSLFKYVDRGQVLPLPL